MASPKNACCLKPPGDIQTRLDEGAIMLKETEAEATLENCRALINQITVGLSAEKPFVDFLSATEVPLYLDFACSALKKSAPLPRERRDTRIAFKYQWH
jgi:hypothetical protein